jgi:hypothetical protein
MPSVTSLARLCRILTLPATRGVIVAAARSEALRDIGHRAVHDRGALVRDLGNPANARGLVRDAARHPATRELANAGLMFLPIRYLRLGWATTWVAHRVLRRYLDPPAEVLDASSFGAGRIRRFVGQRVGQWDSPRIDVGDAVDQRSLTQRTAASCPGDRRCPPSPTGRDEHHPADGFR